ncbi:hypothetical protein [Gallibacterium genomosp. 1]|uniref:hypothetical protein n=1 Tax=Gallibacterium genomosp. 1 TaxID=155515 RepID=UPI0012E80875|nr:hypothetical protein [Gallibacterium genomosp. 1]
MFIQSFMPYQQRFAAFSNALQERFLFPVVPEQTASEITVLPTIPQPLNTKIEKKE